MLYFLRDKMLVFTCLILFEINCFSVKNTTPTGFIKSSLLKKDFDIMRKTLEEAHPGLYWYSSKDKLNEYFDSVGASINQDMTKLDFFKMLLPVIANIKCSHTNLTLSRSAGSDGTEFKKLLPFEFMCQNGKLYISKALNGKEVEGLEVVAINNIETKEIFQTLLKNFPADGYNETIKYQLLSSGAFPESYALFFGQPQNFSIKSINRNRQVELFTVQPVSPSTRSIPQPKSVPISLSFHLNTAILSVNTFQMNKVEFKESVEAVFRQIAEKGVEHLIIDLRQNGGGVNDNVSTLYSYIALGPFLHLRRAEMNTGSITYSNYVTNWSNARKLLNDTGSKGKQVVNHLYAGTSTKMQVNKNLFRGDVVLLTSGKTTSAASEFAAIAHHLKRAKIVGEETGGCYYGATGGNFLLLTLPATRLEVRIPTIRIFTAVDEDLVHQPAGRGTFPDHYVVPAINNFLKGEDVQLKFALNLFNSQTKPRTAFN